MPAISQVRFETFSEGQCAQIMHIGPYENEAPTIARIHQLIEKVDGKMTGKHHEIYLNDPTRTSPEKLKTVIRQPFAYECK